MTTDTDLRAIAEAATPGPWEFCPSFGGNPDAFSISLVGDEDRLIATVWDRDAFDRAHPAQANARHIATFDPPTVLALLDRIAALEAEVTGLRDYIADAPVNQAAALEAERAKSDALRDAALDALSGWRYIRMFHGDLPGVGWDRVENALAAALAKQEPKL